MKWFSRKKAIRIKIYVDRARVYLNYLQAVMLVVVFVKAVFANPTWFTYAWTMAIFGAILFAVGWWDVNSGVFRQEQEGTASEHPIITDMHRILKELESSQPKG